MSTEELDPMEEPVFAPSLPLIPRGTAQNPDLRWTKIYEHINDLRNGACQLAVLSSRASDLFTVVEIESRDQQNLLDMLHKILPAGEIIMNWKKKKKEKTKDIKIFENFCHSFGIHEAGQISR